MSKYVITTVLGLVMLCAQQSAGQGDWESLLSGALKTLSDAAKDTGLIENAAEAPEAETKVTVKETLNDAIKKTSKRTSRRSSRRTAKNVVEETSQETENSCQKQDDTQKKSEKTKLAKGDMSTVAAALEEAGYFTANKAKPKAQYYIFICSASWCQPCRNLMPSIVNTYKNEISKDDRVDLILLGGDFDEAGCAKYLKHYNAKFSGLHVKKKIDLPELPSVRYWPFAICMDADGKVITTGHGSKVLNWKKELSL